MNTRPDTDWRDAVGMFRHRFADHCVFSMPNPPPGVNFCTPEFMGYVRTASGDVAEVSTGTFTNGARIYGVTYSRIDDDPDARDGMVETLDELADMLGVAQATVTP